jgi:hypothetical protein
MLECPTRRPGSLVEVNIFHSRGLEISWKMQRRQVFAISIEHAAFTDEQKLLLIPLHLHQDTVARDHSVKK